MFHDLAAAHIPSKLPADWIGWAFVILVLIVVLNWFLKLLGLIR